MKTHRIYSESGNFCSSENVFLKKNVHEDNSNELECRPYHDFSMRCHNRQNSDRLYLQNGDVNFDNYAFNI